ncbi:PD-(D/E)XK motif protein [Bacillus atrophaeus]|uniref:PD-(D/E)XK motif protein n=1 Tax=Bacillus atrophaeus TaxID=1452 RepID=UPI002E1E77CF|nr:PD-(D/E)XK motif protein [Bacillus atrophaeus]
MKLVKIVTTKNNPWLQLNRLNRIRVKESLTYDVFWIVDALNQYGLMIQCDKDFIQPKRELKLNGIHIQLDNSSKPNKLILLLKEMKDWEIFLILCNDLISILKEQDEDIIINVMKRLERWQKLLQKTTIRVLSKEEQMGLYSELKILRDYLIPRYGYVNSIKSWVGGLGDKQDFLLEKLAIEVKSFRITSGNSVWISSKEQLNSEKDPLYLFACALSEADSGETVADLVQSIVEQIPMGNLLSEFLEKVEQYGYIPELQHSLLSKFIFERINSYEVSKEFPKISLNHVSPWISNMKYSIDLSGCSQFKVKIDDILK